MARRSMELKHSDRTRQSDAIWLGNLPPSTRVDITIGVRAPSLPHALDPKARPLELDEIVCRHGASPEDLHHVAYVLARYDIWCERPSGTRRYLRATGTSAAMYQAFGVRLGVFSTREQSAYRGREGGLTVPAELHGVITGVYGLDQRLIARRHGMCTSAPHHKSQTPREAPIAPADAERLYELPPGGARGQVIGVAEFGVLSGDPAQRPTYLPDDLLQYWRTHGIEGRMPQIRPVNLEPNVLSGLHWERRLLSWSQAERDAVWGQALETMIDLEILTSLCPDATVRAYFASLDQKGWIDLLDAVADDGPDRPQVLSISWGLAENAAVWSGSGRRAIDEQLKIMAMMGVTVCASAGDDGAASLFPLAVPQEDSKPCVEFPASSSNVLAVGGTMLQWRGRTLHEMAWRSSPGWRKPGTKGGATGGGVSGHHAMPSWQEPVTTEMQRVPKRRVVPDVAALAGPPCWDAVVLGESHAVSGTSAATPLWAALLARINAELRPCGAGLFYTPWLYADDPRGGRVGESGCRDIDEGNNASQLPGQGYCSAKGFDAVTGWGVPRGRSLLEALRRAGAGCRCACCCPRSD